MRSFVTIWREHGEHSAQDFRLDLWRLSLQYLHKFASYGRSIFAGWPYIQITVDLKKRLKFFTTFEALQLITTKSDVIFCE